jgi:hypothetical protein
MTSFSDISTIFDNVRSVSIHTHHVDSAPVAAFIKAAAQLFQRLDRSDQGEAQFSLRLWILRSTITFTLLPFDTAALNLRSKMEEISRLSSTIPDTIPLVELLAEALDGLLNLQTNPKMELLNALLQSESIEPRMRRIGLVHALASGSTPGWPVDTLPELANRLAGLKLVGRKLEFSSEVFEKIILPCGCQNAPAALLAEIFHSGRARRIDALLYQGERLRRPNRLLLPATLPFEGRLQQSVIAQESHSDPLDTWVNEAFWQSIHGAARTIGFNQVRAHYALFYDGSGAFLSAERPTRVLGESEKYSDESFLRHVSIENLCDGDLVVLRAGSSGELLDEQAEQIIAGLDEQGLIEDATNWKPALEALLLTHSAEEVAQALHERGGILVSAASVTQWAGIERLGPGNQPVLEALISLLGEKGQLGADQDWKAYAANLWRKLRDLRSVRQRAGNAIAQDLMDALRKQFAGSSARLEDKTIVQLDGGGATKLLILRVSSIDQVAAFIPPSRLLQIDDLRGNKWLG